MMLRALSGLLMLILLLDGHVRGDDPPAPGQPEPPVRLKKKPKPQPAPASEKKEEKPPAAKSEPPKSDEAKAEEARENAEKQAAELAEKIHELTNRVSKNLRAVEDRLDKKDPGEATQEVQRNIVEDLDELIKQTEQREQQDQQNNSSSSSSSQQSKQSRQARAQRMRRNRSTAQRPSPTPENMQPEDAKGTGLRSRLSQQEGMSKIADIYKDVWGNLPETLRQEMDQYSREQFMAKYSDLLKQYYSTIAEKGRKKKE